MSSSGIALASLLPAPSQPTWDRDEERAKELAKEKESDDRRIASFEKTAPPYGARLVTRILLQFSLSLLERKQRSAIGPP